MENEKHEINNEQNEHKYTKNLCYDIDNGKLTINDSENNKYKSDIFGRKIPRFLPNISGIHNRYINNYSNNNQNTFRKSKLSNLKISSFTLPNDSISSNSNNNHNKKKINYTPVIRKFEGYSKFPRPKGPPLLNIPNYEIKEKNKRKIIDNLGIYFSENFTAKNDIIRKNENKGLSYLTKNLNEYDTIKSDTEKLQKLIKNNLDEIKLKYQLKENLYKKDNVVKALNEFNFNISENKNNGIINGRILQEPNDRMKRYYKIINTMLKKNKKFFGKKIEIKNRSVQKNANIKLINDNINKDFTLGKNIKMHFGRSFEEEENEKKNMINDGENKEENKNVEEVIENKEINGDNLNKEENKEEIKEEINDDNLNKEEKKEENKDEENENNEEENEENKMEKILEEKIKNNELSFISYSSENEKKYFKENNIPIKSINRINNKAEHDNKLLEGFIETPIEETKIFQKTKTIRLKTEGDLYNDNIKLLRLTNKRAFLIQEQKDAYDLVLLKKKIRNQTININNAMKVKHNNHKFKRNITDSE